MVYADRFDVNRSKNLPAFFKIALQKRMIVDFRRRQFAITAVGEADVFPKRIALDVDFRKNPVILHIRLRLRVPNRKIAHLLQVLRIHRAVFRAKSDLHDKVFRAKNLVHHATDKMHIVVRNLHEARAGIGQQLARQQQAVAQVRKIRMNPQLPSVAEGLYHLRLDGQIGIRAVLDLAPTDKRLEIAAVFNAVRRVHINALRSPRHPLPLQKRVHHQQGIAGHKPIRPVVLVPVKLHRLAQRRIFAHGLEQRLARPAVAVSRPRGIDNHMRIDLFMHMQRNLVNRKRFPLRFARPPQRRIKMLVVSVSRRPRRRVVRSRQTHRRIVAPLAFVFVTLDSALSRHSPRL